MQIRLDIHTHLVPIDPEQLSRLPGVEWKPQAEELVLDGRKLTFRKLFHPEELIRWMDETGIDLAFVSVPPPLYRQHLEPDAAASWTTYLNRGLDRIAAESGGRLKTLAHLPIAHPELAAAVAADRIAQGGKLFSAPSGASPALRLSDACFDPLWSTLAGTRAFLLLHPIVCHDPRLEPFYLENLVGNAYELAVAAAHLAFAGVAGRYPNLSICLTNGGGATAMAAGRMKRAHEIGRPGIDPRSTPSPAAELGRLLVDCLLHDPSGVALAAETFGRDHVLFGSDWPFPLGLLEPQRQCERLDPGLRRRIFVDNARVLLDR